MRTIFRGFVNTSALISFFLVIAFCCSVYESSASDSLSTPSQKFSVSNTAHHDVPCCNSNRCDCHGFLDISASQLKNNSGINLVSPFLKTSKGDHSPVELLHSPEFYSSPFLVCSLPPGKLRNNTPIYLKIAVLRI